MASSGTYLQNKMALGKGKMAEAIRRSVVSGGGYFRPRAKPLLLSWLHDARALGTAGGAVSGGAGRASFGTGRAAAMGRPGLARGNRVNPGSRGYPGQRRLPRSSRLGGSREPPATRR